MLNYSKFYSALKQFMSSQRNIYLKSYLLSFCTKSLGLNQSTQRVSIILHLKVFSKLFT